MKMRETFYIIERGIMFDKMSLRNRVGNNGTIAICCVECMNTAANAACMYALSDSFSRDERKPSG